MFFFFLLVGAGADHRVDKGWVRTDVEWSFDAPHYDGIIATRRREADIMRDYTRGRRCLMQLLQESLDDPSAEPCGRCSVCLGGLPEPLTAAPAPETVRAVSLLLRGETHVLEPRKMWPGGAFGSRGRIPAELMAEPGRAIVYADAPEWREIIRQVFGADAPAPDDLLSAAVDTLTKWRATWSSRPEVAVALPAAGFPALTASVADHLASVGRLDRADLGITDPPRDPASMSSSEEAAAWRAAIQPSPDVAGRAVLLVVDATSSLWPVTVAAAHLRKAGATTVLPLVIHRRP